MIVAAITRIAQTVDSRPTENPERIVVAGPVWEDSAISFTGCRSVEVKCSVSRWMTLARTSPMTTDQKTRMSSTYVSATKYTASAERAAEMKKPRLMAFIPCSVSLRGVTV